MKKILLEVLTLTLLSCGQKNNFKEIKNDMEALIAEEAKIMDPIRQSKDELPIFDTAKVKELNENFKKKYADIKLEPETVYEQACRDYVQEFPKWVDGFVSLYEKYKAKEITPNVTKSLILIYAQTNMTSNYRSQESFLKACELAANSKK